MKKILLSILIAAGISPVVQARDFKDIDDAIDYRQAAFSLIYHNFADMGDMMKGKTPFDANVFAMRAANVAALSKLPLEGFIPNSAKDSDAKANIWQNRGEFDNKMKQFQLDSAELAQVATQGNKKAIKKAFGTTAKNCKSCHNQFKKD
nr:cytochrome c [Shewanella sp. NFH-SH190041]